MIHLAEMAELVHDDVIGQVRRQEHDLVVEAQCAVLGCASPPRPLVADDDPFEHEPVGAIEMRKAILRERERGNFMLRKIPFAALDEKMIRQVL